MMNKFAKKSALLALLIAGLGFGATMAQAQELVYARSSGMIVKNSTNLCWRTGYWTPAAAAKDPAGCECDKDLLPKDACTGAKVADGKKLDLPPASERVTLAADTLFDFDKATLRSEGKKKLDDTVAKIQGLKLEVVLVVGHTDRIGSDDYNQKLSEKRAAAVKEYLVAKGLEANRVYTEGKGEKWSVTGDKCNKMGAENGRNKKLVECLQPDRRVDVEIIGNKPLPEAKK
ncbi:MAG: OmpA family protein [Betaproteobacteria bacterium]